LIDEFRETDRFWERFETPVLPLPQTQATTQFISNWTGHLADLLENPDPNENHFSPIRVGFRLVLREYRTLVDQAYQWLAFDGQLPALDIPNVSAEPLRATANHIRSAVARAERALLHWTWAAYQSASAEDDSLADVVHEGTSRMADPAVVLVDAMRRFVKENDIAHASPALPDVPWYVTARDSSFHSAVRGHANSELRFAQLFATNASGAARRLTRFQSTAVRLPSNAASFPIPANLWWRGYWFVNNDVAGGPSGLRPNLAADGRILTPDDPTRSISRWSG
jgi:hypothetical protein